ncbi:TetR family transcriptional regulator [Bailinhaonella thermotolerans]|uniref:TetR/AcrR family transcriptional regulator n=1 Tax=Bailinhaonella thermotolerans TaxID=1070861 RepID=A0A3A4AJ04_9ACTN|nr:TetR family transcriptional regulator [Bailinhaonella thermotolerans]RJL20800.1 TetR/AcrR family transcriptional regulator [Bailinhaonella thermotolerans]
MRTEGFDGGGRRDPERRRALLDAADRVIRREGPEASMAAIAAEAGITKPILYRHFGDKGGLFQALADRHIRALVDSVREEFRRPGVGLRQRARGTIGAYFDAVSANLNLYRFLVHRVTAEDSRMQRHVGSVARGVGEELAGVLLSTGVITDQVRAQVLGHAYVGMVQAAGDWWLDHQEVDRREVVEGLVDVIVAAIRGSSEASMSA